MFETKSSKTTPSGLAFTHNPAVLECPELPGGIAPGGVYPLRVEIDGKNVFSGRCSFPYFINIAEIVDAFTPPIPDISEGVSVNGMPSLVCVEDYDMMTRREVYAFVDAEADDELGFFAIPGGVSRQNLRIFNGNDSDVFKERFLATDRNFFFSTRAATWRLVLKETEIAPLYFITDSPASFAVRELATDRELKVDSLIPGIYALDIDALRRHFFEMGVLASVFDIYRDSKFACRIVIERAQPAPERLILKFRNSLGVFELMELTGSPEIFADWQTAEEALFDSYDKIVDDFACARERIPASRTVNVSSGFKSSSELAFMLDMLSSEEVWLLGLAEMPVRVIPTAEDFSFSSRPTTPKSVALTLRLVDDDANIMPDISEDGADFKRRRVFSKHFSKHFN